MVENSNKLIYTGVQGLIKRFIISLWEGDVYEEVFESKIINM